MVWFDLGVFAAFFAIVISVSFYKSRKRSSGEDYFLAGRQLPWWLIGISLIAANISTEQFVGMNGGAAGSAGLAIASYDWIAAIALVLVAIVFVPRFLRSGIYTMPEYLEYRYCPQARGIMAFYTIIIYVAVTISAVLYSGGLTLHTVFGLDMKVSVWLIGILAAGYTVWGGLKAIAWADLFLGSALLIGGLCITLYGFDAVGGVQAFAEHNADKLHMALPADHDVLPWTVLFFGLWIPNFYYWGLNQYITQRTLAARSLKDGQMGVLMAAAIQLVLPLIIVVPGIIAWQLYSDEMGATTDSALPLLIRNLMPAGLRGFIFAAIAGAVISSLASMLNSAATITTMDLIKRYLKPDTKGKTLVAWGRAFTLLFVLIGCLIAPNLNHPSLKGIFSYMQEFQGFISPGILAAFVFGLIFKKAPSAAGMTALISSPIIYAVLLVLFGNIPLFESFNLGEIAFLNRMAITLFMVVVLMGIITWLKPLKEPKALPVKADFNVKTDRSVWVIGGVIIAVTLGLYVWFW